MLTIYRRHRKNCKQRAEGPEIPTLPDAPFGLTEHSAGKRCVSR